MSYPKEIKVKFIELRARDWSYRRIAQELGIDKSTLILWADELSTSISNHRHLEFEALQERLLGSRADRFEALVADYERYRKELENRKIDNLPHYTLFRMVCRLRDEVGQSMVTPILIPDDEP